MDVSAASDPLGTVFPMNGVVAVLTTIGAEAEASISATRAPKSLTLPNPHTVACHLVDESSDLFTICMAKGAASIVPGGRRHRV